MNLLLAQANAILDGAATVPTQSPRAACWLARRALEDIVRELLRTKGMDPGSASMASLLGCLEVAYRVHDPQVAAGAQFAWSALSRASHHHAFELSPTLNEARHLVSLVAEIGSALP